MIHGRAEIAAVALLLAAWAGPPERGAPAAQGPADLIPPVSSLPGLNLAEGPTTYGPETLFEYLDGGAPRYLAHGFRRLANARFTLGGDDSRSIVLDIYDMGTKLGAFGIYSAARPREMVAARWGAEGYRLGNTAAAWKSRFYVHALADEETPALAEALEEILQRIMESVPGDPTPPEILRLLPQEGLVPHTTRHVAKDLFGHSFLPGGLLARYECGSEECLLFLCDLGSPQAARQAMEQLRAYEDERGALPVGEPGPGEDGFLAEDPGLGPGTVIRLGGFVAGAWKGESVEQRRSLLTALAARLDS